jgi:ribonuclease D
MAANAGNRRNSGIELWGDTKFCDMNPSGTHPLAYLDNEEAVARFVGSIASTKEIALDTEGASFHRFIDRIYLLQLSTRERSAIIDPLSIGTPHALGALLEDPTVEVVFHDADYDLRLLHQDYGWHVTKIFDTRIAAQLIGLRAFGLAALLDQFFGVKLDKKYQRADWSERPLTAGMLEYAAQDTRYLLDLRDKLRTELIRLNRLEWAEEEFERLVGTHWPEDDSAQAFFRIKGARDLDRRQLAILRELVIWRDEAARRLDRATFRVVSNEVLLELSRLAPRLTSDLSSIKGMPRGVIDRSGSEVIAAVKRGLAIPDADLPRFPRAPRWDRDPTFDERFIRARAVRDRCAEALQLDPGVLCSRERLEALVRNKPKTPEEMHSAADLRRWQVAQLCKDLIPAICD